MVISMFIKRILHLGEIGDGQSNGNFTILHYKVYLYIIFTALVSRSLKTIPFMPIDLEDAKAWHLPEVPAMLPDGRFCCRFGENVIMLLPTMPD